MNISTPSKLACGLLALLPCFGMAAAPSDAPLLRAVRYGDAATAAALLSGAVDPNRPLPDGSTALSWAVESQNPELVRLLLDAGARVNGLDNLAASPLVVACQYGNSEIIEMLLAAGADANAATSDGKAALALCAGNADTSSVAALLESGANVNRADSRGQTALMHAAAAGRVETIELLVEYGADVNAVTNKGFSPLFFTLKSGVPAAPIALAEAGANLDHVSADGTTVVQIAMYQGDYGFAARMIERGVDLAAFDRNGNQLLHAAVLAAQPELVDLLIKKGAELDATTGPSKVEWRYEPNFKSDEYYVPPKTALQLAAEAGDAEIMSLLIDAGADTAIRTEEGMNIVLAAAASGSFAALQVALAAEPDVSITDARGNTPLHLALNQFLRQATVPADLELCLQLLASKGARPDVANARGETPIDLAVQAKRPEIQELVLAHFDPVKTAL